MYAAAIKILQSLEAQKNPGKARWLENYVKHEVQSLGVGIPDIREIVRAIEKKDQISKQELNTQITFLNDLLQSVYAEPKLAAILFIQLYWKTKYPKETLELCAHWFDEGWITDWNVCDWLCVRLLAPVLDTDPDLAIGAFRDWNSSPVLWKARASLVPFAASKKLAAHKATVLEFSRVLIQRQERFCKTAVAWVLRQYSKIDTQVVTEFLDTYEEWTTREVVKNATKYYER